MSPADLSSQPLELVVDPADAGLRLDVFLARSLPKHSRVQLRKVISAGGVTVNQQGTKVAYKLSAGDRIRIVLPPMNTAGPHPETIPLDWDGIWEARARVTAQGWTAEIDIPFSTVRFVPRDEQVWGINLSRRTRRSRERDDVIFLPRGEAGYIRRFPDLVGIRDIKPGRQLEALAYVAGRGDFRDVAAGDHATNVSAPNNLNFDSNTLFMDSANNRVGVGTNTPDTKFEVQGTASASYGSFGALQVAECHPLHIQDLVPVLHLTLLIQQMIY